MSYFYIQSYIPITGPPITPARLWLSEAPSQSGAKRYSLRRHHRRIQIDKFEKKKKVCKSGYVGNKCRSLPRYPVNYKSNKIFHFIKKVKVYFDDD